MAIILNCPDRTDDIQDDAYWIVELDLSNKSKTGRFELIVWKSEKHRRKNKQSINNIILSVGDEEIWAKDSDDNGIPIEDTQNYVIALAYDDFAWRTGEEVYAKIKTLKVMVDGKKVNLSKAVDA